MTGAEAASAGTNTWHKEAVYVQMMKAGDQGRNRGGAGELGLLCSRGLAPWQAEGGSFLPP